MFEVIVTPSVWMLRYELFMPARERGEHGRSPDQTDAALIGICGDGLWRSILYANGTNLPWVEIFLRVIR